MRHWPIEPGAAWQGYATRGARMLQGGQLPRQGTAEQQEPSLAELLDPVALEARLAEARVRRAEAIARRAGVGATESARPERRPLVGHDTLRKGAAGPPKNVEHLEARQLSSTPPLRAEPSSVAWASKTTVSFPKPKAAPSDHADSRFGLPACAASRRRASAPASGDALACSSRRPDTTSAFSAAIERCTFIGMPLANSSIPSFSPTISVRNGRLAGAAPVSVPIIEPAFITS